MAENSNPNIPIGYAALLKSISKAPSRLSFDSSGWLSQEQVLALPDGTELVEGAHNSVFVLTEDVRMNIHRVFTEAQNQIRLNHEL